jgi:hypothetical protein
MMFLAGITRVELDGVFVFVIVVVVMALFLRFLRIEGQSLYKFLRNQGKTLGGSNNKKGGS